MRRFLAAATLAFAALAAPALAATVEVERPAGSNNREVRYTASPGESNDVTITAIDNYAVRVNDPGAAITVGEGCVAIDDHNAECRSDDFLGRSAVDAGDRDDTVRSDLGLDGEGGPGDDRLMVTGDRAPPSVLDGGGGRDHLTGGPNTDILTDGDTSGAADSDEIDGGGDVDQVDYRRRTRPVVVDVVDPAGDGEAGENDVLTSVESVTGGSGDDRLAGGNVGQRYVRVDGSGGADTILGRDGWNHIYGGDGNDRLLGGASIDALEGEAGEDVLAGNGGNDSLVGGPGADVVGCGQGTDGLGPPDDDVIASDCESLLLRYGAGVMGAEPYPSRVGTGFVSFRLGCPDFGDNDDDVPASNWTLRGRLRLLAPRGRRMGTGFFRRNCGAASGVLVRVRLNRTGRRRAARADGVLATVAIGGRRAPSARWRIRLAIP
jgi:hypothetical protein